MAQPLVVAGLEFSPVPDSWMAVGGFVMLKCINAEDGDMYWLDRTAGAIGAQELIGQFISQSDLLRHRLLQQYTTTED